MRVLNRPINTFLDVQRSFQDILGMIDSLEQQMGKTTAVGQKEANIKEGTIRMVQNGPKSFDVNIMSKDGWLYYNGTAWVQKETK